MKKEETKKETLEEAAEKLYPLTGEIGIDHRNYLRKEGFIDGAKWQADRQDNFAIGFGKWLNTTEPLRLVLDLQMAGESLYETTFKELLEIYKKQNFKNK